MVDEMKDSQSFETVKAKVGQITRWWDLTASFLEKNSTKLGPAVQEVLKATETENPFPEGMDMNWALDVQSAQTLDFFAGMQQGKVCPAHRPEPDSSLTPSGLKIVSSFRRSRRAICNDY